MELKHVGVSVDFGHNYIHNHIPVRQPKFNVMINPCVRT